MIRGVRNPRSCARPGEVASERADVCIGGVAAKRSIVVRHKIESGVVLETVATKKATPVG